VSVEIGVLSVVMGKRKTARERSFIVLVVEV
jgi:hypothetical protein